MELGWMLSHLFADLPCNNQSVEEHHYGTATQRQYHQLEDIT